MKSLEYDDIIGSSMFRSLRRDEVYRYGIVYYDKYGKRSDVQWIGDIRTPRLEECPSTTATKSVNTSDDRIVEGTFYQEVEFVLRGKEVHNYRIRSIYRTVSHCLRTLQTIAEYVVHHKSKIQLFATIQDFHEL